MPTDRLVGLGELSSAKAASKQWQACRAVAARQMAASSGKPQRAELDLLLLREVKSRQVHQEGIFFQGYRYMDTALAGYVGTAVVIYYDPLDLTRVSVYAKKGHSEEERFLCVARCQELGDQAVSLKELTEARNAQRKQLHARLTERKHAVKQTGAPKAAVAGVTISSDGGLEDKGAKGSVSRLKPPAFMAQIAAEFLPEEEVSI